MRHLSVYILNVRNGSVWQFLGCFSTRRKAISAIGNIPGAKWEVDDTDPYADQIETLGRDGDSYYQMIHADVL